MKRRKIDVEVKISVVLEGLRGKVSVAELCRKHQISESLYYRWRDQFLEGGRAALSNGSSDRTKHLEDRIRELERIIGKQTVCIETLKKTSSALV